MSYQIKKAIIPAAGFGTRFLPATKAMPKEMIPIIDKPVIQYIVEEIVDAGIEDILIITGRGKRAIEDHFDQSFELNYNLKKKGKENLLKELRHIEKLANIHYIRQKEILGLGHAVLQAKTFVGDEPFAVLYGDDLVKSKTSCIGQICELYEQYQTSIMAVSPVPKAETKKYGIIKGKKDKGVYFVEDIIEKPNPDKAPSNLASIGRLVLEPEIFSILEKTPPGINNEIQLPDAMRVHNQIKSYVATEINGTWHTTGDPLNYLMTTVEYALDRPDLKHDFIKYLRSLDI
ncbi:UTP--glucose-1-phosphate uridylyltransferase GalU [Patescibacteria group bacterium]|nr:UTP--glucose-1-phosphate uridylyltransferase GalU [Patescibacteria group bacterium]